MQPLLFRETVSNSFANAAAVKQHTVGLCRIDYDTIRDSNVGTIAASASSASSSSSCSSQVTPPVVLVSDVVADLGDLETSLAEFDHTHSVLLQTAPDARASLLRSFAKACVSCFNAYLQTRIRVLFVVPDAPSSLDADLLRRVVVQNVTLVSFQRFSCKHCQIFDVCHDIGKSIQLACSERPMEYQRMHIAHTIQIVVLYDAAHEQLYVYTRAIFPYDATFIEPYTRTVPSVRMVIGDPTVIQYGSTSASARRGEHGYWDRNLADEQLGDFEARLETYRSCSCSIANFPLYVTCAAIRLLIRLVQRLYSIFTSSLAYSSSHGD